MRMNIKNGLLMGLVGWATWLPAAPATAPTESGDVVIASSHDAAAGVAGAAADKAWARVPEILARIVPPVFPARDFVVTNYAAVGDGTTDCSEAFKAAIAACHAAGGGRVVVPSGVFLTGPIHLLSQVNLHLAAGATIRFTTNPAA